MAISSTNLRDYITDGAPIQYECSFRDGDLAVTENIVLCAKRDVLDYIRIASIETASCFYYRYWTVSLRAAAKLVEFAFDDEDSARAFFRAVLSVANGASGSLKTLA